MKTAMGHPDPDSIEQRAIRVIADVLAKQEDEISLTARFIEDLGVNSMELITLAVMLEEEFGGAVPEDEIGGLTTVGALVEYIHSHLDKGASD